MPVPEQKRQPKGHNWCQTACCQMVLEHWATNGVQLNQDYKDCLVGEDKKTQINIYEKATSDKGPGENSKLVLKTEGYALLKKALPAGGEATEKGATELTPDVIKKKIKDDGMLVLANCETTGATTHCLLFYYDKDKENPFRYHDPDKEEGAAVEMLAGKVLPLKGEWVAVKAYPP